MLYFCSPITGIIVWAEGKMVWSCCHLPLFLCLAFVILFVQLLNFSLPLGGHPLAANLQREVPLLSVVEEGLSVFLLCHTIAFLNSLLLVIFLTIVLNAFITSPLSVRSMPWSVGKRAASRRDMSSLRRSM